MTRTAGILLVPFVAMLIFGCATTKVQVMVKPEEVKTEALEPVMLESAELENDVEKTFASYFPASGTAENLMTEIRTAIADTNRFTKVLLNMSEGDTYIIQPRIDSIRGVEKAIPTDPTRRRFIVKAKVRLDVLFINQKNQKELVKSFYDERSLEDRISIKIKLTNEDKQDYFMRTVNVAFRAAADQLGYGFNPGYEMGEISRIEGKIAYVQINTSRIKKMPKKEQLVEVVDDGNQVLATMDGLIVEDGTITGKLYKKSDASIKEGMKVRARVNKLVE